jgi:hypothetical protein
LHKLPVCAGLLVAVEKEDELEVDLLAHGLVPAHQVVLIPAEYDVILGDFTEYNVTN